MLLNKLPCLDKGFVALISSSCTSDRLNEVAIEFFKSNSAAMSLRDISTLTLVIKCPLFLQLNLSTHDLKIVSAPVTDVEAYCPNEGEIGSPDLNTSRSIAANMKMTTDALLINPKAYQEDGCERFLSQVMTPINTYTTLIVHGSYNEWRRFCNQQKIPAPAKSYIKAITQIMNAEWK